MSQSKSGRSVESSKVSEQKEGNMSQVLAERIAELQAVDPAGYKNLRIKEWYSLNEAVSLTGYSRAWIYKQVRSGKFGSRAKLVKVEDSLGNPKQAWLLSASLVEEEYLRFQADLEQKAEIAANPKRHYKAQSRRQKSLFELVDEASPEELAKLRKQLGL